jgi:intracellular septation protein
MTDEPKLTDEIREGDRIVDRAMGVAAEKLGEANPELALEPGEPKQNHVKMAVDYGPLIAFGLTFLACKFFKLVPAADCLIWASGVLGVASVLALIGGLVAEKRIAWIPLVSCLITIPMTALTVLFHDATFVKIKMTIVDVLIGGILLGALAFRKQPLKTLLGEALKLKESAWPRLTLYYALFYLAMAAVNEAVWRTQSDEFWLTWKLVSMIAGPILLSICLLPFLMKNMIVNPEADKDE